MSQETLPITDDLSLRQIAADIIWLPLKAGFGGLAKSVKDFIHLNLTLVFALLHPSWLIRNTVSKEKANWQIPPILACRTSYGFYVIVLLFISFLCNHHIIRPFDNSLSYKSLETSNSLVEQIVTNQTVDLLINAFSLSGYFIGLFACVLVGRLWGRIFPVTRVEKRLFDSIYIYQYNLYFYLATIAVLVCAMVNNRHITHHHVEVFVQIVCSLGILICLTHSFALYRKISHQLELPRWRRWASYPSVVLFAGCMNAFFAALAALPALLNLSRG